jgi:hypothetical protein
VAPVGSGLVEPEWLAGRDPQLVGDEVAPGDQLRDRVLDLEPGVHLEKGRFAAFVDDELARARADVADLAGEGQGGGGEPLPQRAVDRWRGRLLEDLLVPPLDRAVAFAEVDAVAMRVEQDLDLDVAAALDQALEDQPLVAECRPCLAAGGGQRIGQAVRLADRTHPLAAAAGGRLDQQREADARGGTDERPVGLVGAVVAGQDRDFQGRGKPARRRLVAHRPDRGCGRPDPADPGRDDRLGERGNLGQEPEPRVNRVSACAPGGIDDRGRVEEVQRIHARGCRQDDANAEAVARPCDPRRDLAPVGDEERSDRSGRGDRRRRGALGNCERVNRVTRDTPPTPKASRW